MKKRFSFLVSILPLLLLSCSEDASSIDNYVDNDRFTGKERIEVINMIVPDVEYDDASTRATFVEGTEGLKFVWEKNDAIGIVPTKGFPLKFLIDSESSGSNTAMFDGGDWALRSEGMYAAFYPYEKDNFDSDINNISIDYTGQTQDNYMKYDFLATGAVAPKSGQVVFNMKRLSAILKISIQMPAGSYGRYGTLIAPTAVWGLQGTLDLSQDIPSYAAESMEKFIHTDVGKDMNSSSEWNYNVYLIIPPSDLSGKNLTFRITSDKGYAYEATLEGKNFEAGKAYLMQGVSSDAIIKNANLIAAITNKSNNPKVEVLLDPNGCINVNNNKDELAKVIKIDVGEKNDPTVCDEIGFLTNLKTLWCYGNQLTSLDVSNNTTLQSLNCYNNQLTSLDVSNNNVLYHLDCSDNELKDLKVSNNSVLQLIACDSNRLTLLDISGCLSLKSLYCSSNNLESLDVSGNKNLSVLTCIHNHLSQLDISKNAALEDLNCSENLLTSLDVSNNQLLGGLTISKNELVSLDISTNIELTYLDCSSNKLVYLDVRNNKKLEKLYCSDNYLSLLDVSENEQLDNLYCFSNNLVSLDLSNNKMLSWLKCYSNFISTLNVSKCSALSLNMIECGRQSYSKETNDFIPVSLLVSEAQFNNSYLLDNSVNGNNYLVNVTIVSALSERLTNSNLIAAAEANEGVSFIKDSDGTVDLSNNSNREMLDKVKSIDVRSTNDPTVCEEIGYFTNLEMLYCSYNELTSLDVSKNTKLKELECDENQLTALDVSKNSDLTELSCTWNSLTELDLSNNPKLVDLDCKANAFSTLDLSKNVALEKIDCAQNQLSSINLSKCALLTKLECDENKLSFLDISNNMAIVILICNDNLLNSLDLSKNTVLESLQCQNNKLVSLDLSNNVYLADIECQNNRLQSIRLSNNNNLNQLDCYNNLLTEISLLNCPNLKGVDCSGNIMRELDITCCSLLQLSSVSCGRQYESVNSNITVPLTLSVTGEQKKRSSLYNTEIGGSNYLVNVIVLGSERLTNSNLIAAAEANEGVSFIKDPDGTVDLSNSSNREVLDKVKSINVSSKNDPTVCDEIGYFTQLETLYCYSNQLTSLDVANNKSLVKLDCSYNQIFSLDLTNNFLITDLNCCNNYLSSLSLDRNTALIDLALDNNYLTSLDLSKNTALEELDCDHNQLSTLNISSNSKLRRLDCKNNNLKVLDVNSNTLLEDLYCSDNLLISLDVSNNTNLKTLYVYNCPNLTSLSMGYSYYKKDLTSLSVKNCPKIVTLDLMGSGLTSLDVTGCSRLINLNASRCKLTTLDVSDCTKLESLQCADNLITTLDISKNAALKDLWCYGNLMSSLNVTKCPNLAYGLRCGNQWTDSNKTTSRTLSLTLTSAQKTNMSTTSDDNSNITYITQ